MEWAIVLLEFILVFIVVALKESYSEKKRRAPQTLTARKPLTVRYPIIYHQPWHYQEMTGTSRRLRWMQELSRMRQLSRLRQFADEEGNSIVKKWRKSIVSLVKLADKNLAVSEQHLKIKDYKSAIQAASTSVENIARALIHCFGAKPDLGSGQEEALRMLSRRFQGDEKARFEKATDAVARIGHNRAVLKYLSTHKTQIRLFDERETKQMLESASKIVTLFKRIITEHFAAEIPELDGCMHVRMEKPKR